MITHPLFFPRYNLFVLVQSVSIAVNCSWLLLINLLLLLLLFSLFIFLSQDKIKLNELRIHLRTMSLLAYLLASSVQAFL